MGFQASRTTRRRGQPGDVRSSLTRRGLGNVTSSMNVTPGEGFGQEIEQAFSLDDLKTLMRNRHHGQRAGQRRALGRGRQSSKDRNPGYQDIQDERRRMREARNMSILAKGMQPKQGGRKPDILALANMFGGNARTPGPFQPTSQTATQFGLSQIAPYSGMLFGGQSGASAGGSAAQQPFPIEGPSPEPSPYSQMGPNEQRAWLEKIPSKEEGGGIPKTGVYQLHEGEQVIPAPEKLQEMVMDMMLGRQSKGKKKGKGYEEGTVGYQEGTDGAARAIMEAIFGPTGGDPYYGEEEGFVGPPESLAEMSPEEKSFVSGPLGRLFGSGSELDEEGGELARHKVAAQRRLGPEPDDYEPAWKEVVQGLAFGPQGPPAGSPFAAQPEQAAEPPPAQPQMMGPPTPLPQAAPSPEPSPFQGYTGQVSESVGEAGTSKGYSGIFGESTERKGGERSFQLTGTPETPGEAQKRQFDKETEAIGIMNDEASSLTRSAATFRSYAEQRPNSPAADNLREMAKEREARAQSLGKNASMRKKQMDEMQAFQGQAEAQQIAARLEAQGRLGAAQIETEGKAREGQADRQSREASDALKRMTEIFRGYAGTEGVDPEQLEKIFEYLMPLFMNAASVEAATGNGGLPNG